MIVAPPLLPRTSIRVIGKSYRTQTSGGVGGGDGVGPGRSGQACDSSRGSREVSRRGGELTRDVLDGTGGGDR